MMWHVCVCVFVFVCVCVQSIAEHISMLAFVSFLCVQSLSDPFMTCMSTCGGMRVCACASCEHLTAGVVNVMML